jgi:hypothetical protein
MRAGAVLSACALALALACTVDEIVGSNALSDGGPDGGHPDGGTPICPGTGDDCSPVCGEQICHSGCTDLHDCVIECAGTSCGFRCEHSGPACTTSCEPGPCALQCGSSGPESLNCSVTCDPLQTCAVDCHGGTCVVACGNLEPATRCDAGVYSCSDRCPP